MADPDARRRAEKALLYNRTHANSPRVREALVEALEALLASEPAPPPSDAVREAAERHLHEAISAWHHDPLSTSRASTVVHFAEGLLSVLAARGGE